MVKTLVITNLCIFIFIVVPVEFFRATYIYKMSIAQRFSKGYIPYIPLFCMINTIASACAAISNGYISTRNEEVGLGMSAAFVAAILLFILGMSMTENTWRNLSTISRNMTTSSTKQTTPK